jgi:phage terminase large subunit GpA-like protein
MNPLKEGVAAGIVTSYQGDPLDWLAEHVRLPHSARSTRFQPDNAPWLNDIFRAVCDDRVKQIVARAPTGGGKTTLLELVVPWIVAQQPGPMMLVGQTDETTKEWAESRLMPILESCPPVARLFPHDRHQKRKTAIMFPHMALFLNGANMSSLQEKSMRYCYGDECWRWDAGLIDELKKRHHDRWNRKTILVSQGSSFLDDFDREFTSGIVHEWGTECESCGQWHKYLWANVKYEEVKTNVSEWDYNSIKASVRHECPLCGHATLDTTQGRRGMASRGRYEAQANTQALAGNVSFTWAAQAVWWISWADMVVEWLKANDEKTRGNTEPLKQFRQKRLAQSWQAEHESPEINLTAGDYDMRDFADGQSINGEAKRLFAIDRQKDHFWGVIRAFRSDGSSRLIWCGRVLS